MQNKKETSDQPHFSPSDETRRADPSDQIKARVRQVMEEIRACTPGARLADVPTLFAFGPIERALTEAASAEDDWIRIATKNAEDGLARQAALEAEIRALRATLEERTRELQTLRAKFAGTERARAHWERIAKEKS